MVQLFAFRRSLRVLALALCSAAIAVSATPASQGLTMAQGVTPARYHAGHHARRHYAHIGTIGTSLRASRWERGVAQMQARRLCR